MQGKATPAAGTTATLSISSVLEEHRGHNDATQIHADVKRTIGHDQNRSRPVDIAVVVFSISIDYERKSITLMAGDDSISLHERVRILLYKVNTNTMDKYIQINQGDIVRLNNIHVKNDYGSRFSNQLSNEGDGTKDSSLTQKLMTILCDFSFDWRKPEAGESICPIAKIATNTSPSPSYHIFEAIHLPYFMATSQDVIKRLMSWYESNFVHTRNNKASSFDVKATPLKRRKLNELISSNLLSEITVYVVTIENKPVNLNQISTMHFTNAVLSEESGIKGDGDYIPFVYDRLRYQYFHTQLIYAHEKKHPVKITNVLTQSTSMPSSSSSYMSYRYRGSLMNQFEHIVVPTSDTTIVKVDPKNVLTTSPLSISTQNSLSQLISLNEETTIFSHCDRIKKPTFSMDKTHLLNRSAFISSITFQISTQHQIIWSNETNNWPNAKNDLVNVMFSSSYDIKSTIYCYRPSTLTLKVQDRDDEDGELKVSANGNIMSILCGSFNPSSVISDDENWLLLLNLLQGLVCLEVNLEWQLEKNDEIVDFSARDVHLQSINF